jgi:glycosyltransferase involved in cell wall biosynthesis
MLTETNIRGAPSDRASWLRHTLEQCELARSRGVPLSGYCWYPYIDSLDWDSMLARAAWRVDPVGVYTLERGDLRRTLFTEIWEAAAQGVPAADLPAYRFQSPLDSTLAGFLPLMEHWEWEDPPQPIAPISIPHQDGVPLPSTSANRSAKPVPFHRAGATQGFPTQPAMPDLIVISHLRWVWVWQRPQHLVARFAMSRTAAGASVWFVEEPVRDDVAEPVIRWTDGGGGVTRVWLAVPADWPGPTDLGFDAPAAAAYSSLLRDFLSRQAAAHDRPAPDVLIYTPMAYDLATELKPGRLAYDVMDDLASFLDAPEGLRLRQRRLLTDADVVFTGGRSLHATVSAYRKRRCYLYPSGVDTAHYASSMMLRRPHTPPVAGYVGVLDERLDLGLIADLARMLPDWTVRMVGPITKIPPDSVPEAANLEYLGKVGYEQLPAVMAGFDVALMPFALNEATRSISPTKTLEYLAAGLPVVSTRVPDVVADYGDVVALADDAAAFASACRVAARQTSADRERRLRAISGRQEWDRIAAEMDRLIRGVPVVVDAALTGEATA